MMSCTVVAGTDLLSPDTRLAGAGMFDDLDLSRKRHLVNEGARHFWRFMPTTDVAMDAPSRLDGWTRRQLTAHLGFHAAGLRRLVEGVARGVPTPMYCSPEQRTREIADAVDLDAAALRQLFDDEHDRLHAAWCELSPSDWDATVSTPQGKAVPVAATLWMRNRELWVHAVDLGMGAWFDQVPPVILTRLFDDIAEVWRDRGIAVEFRAGVAGIVTVTVSASERDVPASRVVGPLPSVLQWMTGRGNAGSTGEVYSPPKWL
jgi:maleylpyruvate isomerase